MGAPKQQSSVPLHERIQPLLQPFRLLPRARQVLLRAINAQGRGRRLLRNGILVTSSLPTTAATTDKPLHVRSGRRRDRGGEKVQQLAVFGRSARRGDSGDGQTDLWEDGGETGEGLVGRHVAVGQGLLPQFEVA